MKGDPDLERRSVTGGWAVRGAARRVHLVRWVACFVFALCTSTVGVGARPDFASTDAVPFGPDHLIRLDLSRRADFECARQLGFAPVHRTGNAFYFILDGSELMRLDGTHLGYDVISGDVAIPPPLRAAVTGEADDRRVDRTAVTDRVPFEYMDPVVSVAAAQFEVDPLLDTIADRVYEDSVLAIGSYLEGLQTRYTFTDSNKAAREFLIEKLQSYGYTDVRTDTFYVSDWSIGFFHGPWGHNVICTKPGTLEPDRIVLLGAHYDSHVEDGNNPLYHAPGADRNASGTAAVLEAARVLADLPLRKTVIFAFFGGGEQDFEGASQFARYLDQLSGSSLDVMINCDRIGFTSDAHPDINISSDENSIAYARLAVQMAFWQTGLKPRRLLETKRSNWEPFSWRGFRWVDITEGDYNAAAENTIDDRLSLLDPDYWTEATRIAALTTYAVAATPSAVRELQAWDVGDGQGIEVRWAPMAGPDIAGYRVHWGTNPEALFKSVDVMGGDTTVVVTPLTQGVEYVFAVGAVTNTGHESSVLSLTSLAPLQEPRAPTGLHADVGVHELYVSWDVPPELDLSRFVIYRGTDSIDLTVYVPEWNDTAYTDTDQDERVRYYYRVQSVDHGGAASPLSEMSDAIAATFDRGVLILNATASHGLNPSDSLQKAFYRSVFSNYLHEYYRYEDYDAPLDKSRLGAFRVLAWIDDDDEIERWRADHWAKLNWFLSHQNDLIIVGWQTTRELASCRVTCQQRPGDFLLDYYDVFNVTPLPKIDCLGGLGVWNYPDVVFDTAKVPAEWEGKMGYLWGVDPRWPATYTLTYNPATDDEFYTGFPVGIRRGFAHNKLAFLTLPLYYIRLDDAREFMTAVVYSFEQPTLIPGDLDGDANATMNDIAYIINVMYRKLIPIGGYEYVDLNGDCEANVADVVVLIDYILHNGPEPATGCAE